MSVFLAATLTTFAIYCLIAFSHPGWVDGAQSAPTINWRVPRWLANTLLIVICVVGIVGLLFATFRFLHSDYSRAFDLFDAFTGRNAASLLFGTITGVLLGAFITRVFFRNRGSPIEGRDKIIVALLLLFFALGIGGEEAIRGLAQRVSKVSALGTEIDFFEPAKSSSKANTRGSASNAALAPTPATAAPSNAPTTSASSYGLTFLSHLGLYIDRDQKYSVIAVKLSGGDQKAQDAGIKEINEGLSQPIEFAKLIVEPFAACLEEVQAQTGDTEFVNDRLLGLVDELRILIAPDRDDEDMPSRLTSSFFKQADELASFAVRIAIGVDGSGDPNKRRPRAKSIAESCNRLYFLLLDAECWRERKGETGEAACWEQKKNVLKANAVPADWVWTHREEIRALYHHAPVGADRKQASISQRASAVEYFKKVISHVSAPGSYQSLPYVSLVYAAVMAQLGRSEAALVELDRWLQRAAPDVGSSWYAVRALSTLSILTEEWLRRPSTYVPTVLLEYHINNNKRVADLLERILQIEKFRNKYAKLPESLENTGFHSRPHENRNCQASPDEADGFEMLQLAFAARVTADLIVAQHALSHPGYPSLYSHEVDAAMKSLMNTDLSCMAISGGEEAVDQSRAESLRLYALMKLRDASAIAEIRGRESADDGLKSGLDAIALATEIIYPRARKDRGRIGASEPSPNETPTLFDRISPTVNMDTLEEVTLLRSQLLDARKDLSKE